MRRNSTRTRREPRVIWLPCPISAALAVIVYATLVRRRLVPASEAKPVRSAVYSAIDSAIDSAVDSAVRLAVYSAIDPAVGSAVGSAIRSVIASAVYSAIYSAVGSALNSAVNSAVASAIHSSVYSAVDSAVDSEVNSAVRSAVASAVGSAVGSAIDFKPLIAELKPKERKDVHGAGVAFFGGSLWPGYCAWADYFDEICGIAIDRNYLDLAESCGFYWTLDSICFASERPSEILRDDRGRLHNDRGMAIRYPSGWGLYRVHGVEIPADVIERPDSLTASRITNEHNAPRQTRAGRST